MFTEPSKIDKAVAFLEHLFAIKDEYLWEEIEKAANGEFDNNLLYRAKNKLGSIEISKQLLTHKGEVD